MATTSDYHYIIEYCSRLFNVRMLVLIRLMMQARKMQFACQDAVMYLMLIKSGGEVYKYASILHFAIITPANVGKINGNILHGYRRNIAI